MAETEPTGTTAASTQPSAQPSAPTTLPGGSEPSAPAGETQPQTEQGPEFEDASLTSGSHSLDGMVPAASSDDYQPKAKSVLLYDMTSDTILVSHNPDERRYPASLTKVMTTLTALKLIDEQQIDIHTVVTIPEDLPRRAEGATMDLQAGEEIELIDLLYGIMVDSSNDACMAVAEFLSGSEEAFIAEMNSQAAELGCTGTNFTNVHGLHEEEHYTTARDMAKIMLAAVQYELFEELYSTPEYDAPATNLSEPRKMVSSNFLINESGFDLYYDSRAIGGKTGYTTPAGRCLVSVSRTSGSDLKLLSVVMGASMKVAEDGFSILSDASFEETRSLMNFGFSTYMPAQVLSDAQTLGQFPVAGGDSDAHGRVRGSVNTALPIGTTANDLRYEYVLRDDVMHAPLPKDESIGMVQVWFGNRCLAQQELFNAGLVKEPVPVAEFPELTPAGEGPEQKDLRQIVLGVGGVVLIGAALILIFQQVRQELRRRKRKKKVERRRAELERERRRRELQERMKQAERGSDRLPSQRRREQPGTPRKRTGDRPDRRRRD